MTLGFNWRRNHAVAALGLAVAASLCATARADEIQNNYTLAAGATSAPIAVPGTNTPVSLTCVNNTSGYRGVGQATMLRVAAPTFLEWVGMDIATSMITSNFSAAAGTHIIYCSYSDKFVDIQVQSATSIQIKNSSGFEMSGVITWVW